VSSRVVRLVLGSVVALFAFDVQVDLRLPWGLLHHDPLWARPRDFAGLLLADVQAALAAVMVALVLGAMLARFPRGRSLATESTALVPALLCTYVVLAQSSIVWGLSGSAVGRAAAIAAMVGGVVWAAIRFGLGSEPPASLAIFAPLVLGHAHVAVAGVIKGRGAFMLDAGLAVLWLAVGWSAARVRRSAWSALLHGAPGLVAIGAAIAACSLGPRVGPLAQLRGESHHAAPTIVLVVLDTVRADHLDLYGYGRPTMPQLTRWSSGALVFRRAVSPAGWTAPAHASILSGLPVSLHGVHYGEHVFVTPPRDGVRWLPQELASRGYTSLAITANSFAVPEGVLGFDLVLAPRRNAWHAGTLGALVDHRSPFLDGASERLGWRMPHVDAAGIVDLVTEVVPNGREPHFLLVNLLDAHSPYNPPSSALVALGLEPGRAFHRWRSHRELTRLWESLPMTRGQELADLYDGELRAIDGELARLLQWVERRYAGQAIVIVTSDHGEELGEEGRVGHETGLAQRLLHVPLLIHGPGIDARTTGEIADLRGLHRFMLSLADGGSPDLAALLEPDEFGIVAERYPSGFGGGSRRAWVSRIEGERKGIGPSAGGFQLFDLGRDFSRDEPIETAAGAELRERIDTHWESHRDRRQEQAAITDEERSRLRSLGYVR
jgi:hypothetical protein